MNFKKSDIMSVFEFMRLNEGTELSDKKLYKKWLEFNSNRLTKEEKSEFRDVKVFEYDFKNGGTITFFFNPHGTNWKRIVEKFYGTEEYFPMSVKSCDNPFYIIGLQGVNGMKFDKYKDDKDFRILSETMDNGLEFHMLYGSIHNEDEGFDKYVMENVVYDINSKGKDFEEFIDWDFYNAYFRLLVESTDVEYEKYVDVLQKRIKKRSRKGKIKGVK